MDCLFAVLSDILSVLESELLELVLKSLTYQTPDSLLSSRNLKASQIILGSPAKKNPCLTFTAPKY